MLLFITDCFAMSIKKEKKRKDNPNHKRIAFPLLPLFHEPHTRADCESLTIPFGLYLYQPT